MIDTSGIYTFLLILVRMTSFFVTSPIFSSKTIPSSYKIGLAFFISLVLYPTLDLDLMLTLDGEFMFLIIQEAILGMSIGFMAQLIFYSIQVAGSFVDLQIGFSLANVIDPQTGAQSPIMGNFKYVFAVLLFFSLNIHHLLIEAIISSYEILPLTGDWLNQLSNDQVIVFIVSLFSKMFLIAFKMSAPLVVTLLLTDIALGILARTVPQLNVFVVGMPLKIVITFFLLLLLAAVFIDNFRDLFYEMINSMKEFMELMRL